MNSRLRGLAAALAAAVAATLVGVPTGQAHPAPSEDSFYVPPSPLPEGRPGDVIRSRPAAAAAVADRGVTAWQVMYRSTDALDRPMAVVGTVLVPRGVDPKTAPVVSLAAGTHGPGFGCRVSHMSEIGAFYEQPAANEMLDQGWIVVMTDYEGYQPQPRTTYITGRSEGHAVLDLVRAAGRMPQVGALAPTVLLRGYSQGGGAALWAAELAPAYAPELNLVGVVAGGVPADLVQVTLFLEGRFGFGFLLYALHGLDNAYAELDLENYLNDAGRQAIAEMKAGDCTVELLVKYRGKRLNEYLTSSPVLTEAWLARVGQNKLGAGTIGVPVLQYHGTQDDVVDYRQAKKLGADYCAKGVKLTWRELPKDHIGMIFHGNRDALAFLKDRVAGVPATSNCA
ncbi:lipase family protein [Actinokineospora guangxiensis]|uniref:Lipase family protein n=1 Tax=Actinokineospora guangxiensis TaxID=1490288 RepID=A0ABW0EU33_9PSEU